MTVHKPPPTRYGVVVAQAKGRQPGGLPGAAPAPLPVRRVVAAPAAVHLAPGVRPVQMKPQPPGPPVPAAARRNGVPGAIQAMEGRRPSVELSEQAVKMLIAGKNVDADVQEVQIMGLPDGKKMYSTNRPVDGKYISAGMEGMIKYKELYGEAIKEATNKETNKLAKLPKGIDVKSLFTSVIVKSNASLLENPVNLAEMKFLPGEHHAEQNLLSRLAVVLASNFEKMELKPKTISVYGAKPPCNRCRPVLDAFAAAALKVYQITIAYNKTGASRVEWYNAPERKGVDKEKVGSLTAEDIAKIAEFDEMVHQGTRFAEFLAAYRANYKP